LGEPLQALMHTGTYKDYLLCFAQAIGEEKSVASQINTVLEEKYL
jgi:hypothetical protein